MADISSDITKRPELLPDQPAGRAERDRSLVALVELLFFAYRDFTGDPDEILAEFQFGRAHHRVLHFVEHYPGLRVADLLDILKITKQSLARVLRQLVAAVSSSSALAKPTGASDGCTRLNRDGNWPSACWSRNWPGLARPCSRAATAANRQSSRPFWRP